MENASQALLIAGGILLAILTLTLLVFMFGNLNTIGTAQAERQEAERLAEWNAEWEAYNRQLLRGADVLTVINKAEQNNLDYDNDVKYTVTVSVSGSDKDGNRITKNNIVNYKTNIFKCTRMDYNNQTGRVNIINYEFVR